MAIRREATDLSVPLSEVNPAEFVVHRDGIPAQEVFSRVLSLPLEILSQYTKTSAEELSLPEAFHIFHRLPPFRPK